MVNVMNNDTKKVVDMWSDGACKGNPGPGGWGVLIRFGTAEKEISGGLKETTNNQMELMGAITGLEALTQPCVVNLYVDSKYVMKGIQEWMPGWKRNGWRTASRKAVKNADLWRRLDAAMVIHEVNVFYIAGHSGHSENDRADELANMGVMYD